MGLKKGVVQSFELDNEAVNDSKVKKESSEKVKNQEEIPGFDALYNESDSIWIRLSQNPETIKLGAELFQNNCVACHNSKGQGLIGPNLTDEYWVYGGSLSQIAKVTLDGTQVGMPNYKHSLTPIEVGQMTIYVYSLRNNPIKGKAPQGNKE